MPDVPIPTADNRNILMLLSRTASKFYVLTNQTVCQMIKKCKANVCLLMQTALADGRRSRYSGMFNVISVINLGFWSELCVQRILTLWGRVCLLELEWKCQSLSYFSPPPLLQGSCKTCDVCRRLHRVCVCACGGSHVPSPACTRPCDAGPASHPPRPPLTTVVQEHMVTH